MQQYSTAETLKEIAKALGQNLNQVGNSASHFSRILINLFLKWGQSLQLFALFRPFSNKEMFFF